MNVQDVREALTCGEPGCDCARRSSGAHIVATTTRNSDGAPTTADVGMMARAANRAGLCVIPVREDGSKVPDLLTWKRYQFERPSADELSSWFGAAPDACERRSLGYVMGGVSCNAEAIDFDEMHTFLKWLDLATAAGAGELVERVRTGYQEFTPKPGVHLVYRCEVVSGNMKLASRLKLPDEMKHGRDRIAALIETRGEGGFIVAAPSHGSTHATGRRYSLVHGGPQSIVTISAADREVLHDLARALDELPVSERPSGDVPRRSRRRASTARPGDDFIARTSWSELLEPEGWVHVYERNGVGYWRRPGKEDRGISATTNFGGSDLFYPFTTSSEFEPERGYNRFSVYGLLHHGGDFRAAARALAANGFGGTPDRPRRAITVEVL